jgi:xanthine dehydrogenase YagS FAD-binding subunit
VRRFAWVEPGSLEEAVAVLAAAPETTRLIGGGSDLLGEMKEGVETPERLVSVPAIPGLDAIAAGPEGLRLGAAATLHRLLAEPVVWRDYPVLAHAALRVATPQIRTTATVAGNLCQRPRCWYYRSPHVACRKKGGTTCPAIEGQHRYLAVIDGGPCLIVHPSDLAPPLVALDATIHLVGPAGRRSLALEDFFVGPARDVLRENVLGPGELVAEVSVPPPRPGARSLFLKTRERSVWDFAMTSCTVVLRVRDDVVDHVRIVLGGVAPTPYRPREAEARLLGRRPTPEAVAEAARLALAPARPLPDNAYKVPQAEALIRRAVGSLSGPPVAAT